MAQRRLSGGCACGAVRFEVCGEPLRTGLCHCLTCRKTHAAAFKPFVIFSKANIRISGDLHSWQSSRSCRRQFCPLCGAHVAEVNGKEVELSLGSFDEPGLFEPAYEIWTIRREPWLPQLDVPQHSESRPAADI